MRFKRGVFLVVVFFIIPLISASFQTGNLSNYIETQYGPSEKISGWINISLRNEPGDSLFTDSSNNSMTLLNFIIENANFRYSCIPKNCTPEYTTDGSSKNVLTFNLNPEQEKIVGIKLRGDIKYVTSLKLSFSSNAEGSCYSQVGIDFLNDGSVDFANNKKPLGTDSCSFLFSKGCFIANQSYEQQYSVAKFPYKHCQKIIFPPSTRFRIGAWLSNPSNDYTKVKMAVYTLNMEEILNAGCNLSSNNILETGEKFCEVDLDVKEPTPYFVCIYSDEVDYSKLRGYGDNALGCGFYQESQNKPQENAAFDIFAQGLGFGPVGEILISDSSEQTMSNIKNYIYNRYGSYNCDENTCIIPFLLTSKIFQEITLKDLKLEYTTALGSTDTKDLYTIKEISPKISSEFQKMFLNYGNFTAPEEYGENSYRFNLSGLEIFSKTVYVKDFPKITYLYPILAPSLIPVDFIVYVNSSKNIDEYSWDFNDSTSIQKTTTGKIAHTFNRSGTYYVTVSVKDSEGLNVSKTFNILSTIPQEQIGTELEKKLDKLTITKNSLNSFDSFTQKGLNSALYIGTLEEKLKTLQREYSFASTEQDYSKLVMEVSLIEVPESVAITKSSPPLLFFPMTSEIDLDVLQSVGGGDYNSERSGEYKDALLGWQMQNAKIKVGIEGFSSRIGNEEKSVLTKFVVNIEKNYSEKPVYLFLRKMKDLTFKENYFEKESGNYFYWELGEDTKEIEFSTSETINYEELPIFLSPEISELVISEPINPVIKNLKAKVGIISISLLILIFAAMVVYTMLSIWYKRKYESYLFKNRNDLYNLISYVAISKKKGDNEENISSNLKKSGWTGEQITYVLKKYSGKRTGMIELPLTKLIDKIMGSNQKPKAQVVGANQRIGPQNRNFLDKNGKVL